MTAEELVAYLDWPDVELFIDWVAQASDEEIEIIIAILQELL